MPYQLFYSSVKSAGVSWVPTVCQALWEMLGFNVKAKRNISLNWSYNRSSLGGKHLSTKRTYKYKFITVIDACVSSGPLRNRHQGEPKHARDFWGVKIGGKPEKPGETAGSKALLWRRERGHLGPQCSLKEVLPLGKVSCSQEWTSLGIPTWGVWPQREVAVDSEASSSGCQAVMLPSAQDLMVHLHRHHDTRKEEKVVITEDKLEGLDLV